jgi:hypothetical protein
VPSTIRCRKLRRKHIRLCCTDERLCEIPTVTVRIVLERILIRTVTVGIGEKKTSRCEYSRKKILNLHRHGRASRCVWRCGSWPYHRLYRRPRRRCEWIGICMMRTHASYSTSLLVPLKLKFVLMGLFVIGREPTTTTDWRWRTTCDRNTSPRQQKNAMHLRDYQEQWRHLLNDPGVIPEHLGHQRVTVARQSDLALFTLGLNLAKSASLPTRKKGGQSQPSTPRGKQTLSKDIWSASKGGREHSPTVTLGCPICWSGDFLPLQYIQTPAIEVNSARCRYDLDSCQIV